MTIPGLMGLPAALRDRLEAMVEAVVIGDRWAIHCSDSLAMGDRGWQGGFLRVGQACVGGDVLLPQLWRPHFQGLTSAAAVAVNAFPYLWIKADAHGHHRAAVGLWMSDLEVSPAATRACDDLFMTLCRAMAPMGAGDGPDEGRQWLRPREHWGEGFGPAVELVAQSQGQLAVALGLAHQRHYDRATTALVALLVGLGGGRASLSAEMRQRWLIDYRVSQSDPWAGLTANALAELAAALYHRWAGAGGQPPLSSPSFALGIRV
jgi:hypothetical protein